MTGAPGQPQSRGLLPEEPTTQLEDWNFQHHPLTSGEGRRAGDQVDD